MWEYSFNLYAYLQWDFSVFICFINNFLSYFIFFDVFYGSTLAQYPPPPHPNKSRCVFKIFLSKYFGVFLFLISFYWNDIWKNVLFFWKLAYYGLEIQTLVSFHRFLKNNILTILKNNKIWFHVVYHRFFFWHCIRSYSPEFKSILFVLYTYLDDDIYYVRLRHTIQIYSIYYNDSLVNSKQRWDKLFKALLYAKRMCVCVCVNGRGKLFDMQ